MPVNSSLKEDNPVFIVGAARSGTTLLQYMLRSHPEISLPTAESHFFIPFYRQEKEFGDLTNKDNIRALLEAIYSARKGFFDEDVHGIRYDIDSLTEMLQNRGCSTLPELISGIFQANAKAEGKTRWGDKTPYYVLHLDTLLEMFPGAQIIHLIRDGRDCALSMLERRWDLQIFNTYHAAYIWNRYVTAGQDFGMRHPDRYFELRYEDILNHPVSSMERLCNFLHIRFDDSVINFKKSDGSGKTALLTKPLQKSNQAKWKRRMSEKQLAVFESVAGPALEKCGYEPAIQAPSISKLDWFLYELQIRLGHFFKKHVPVR